MTEEVPENVQQLLHDSVHTYEELEALLLLYRERSRGCAAGEIAAAIGMNVEAFGTTLAGLVAGKLVVEDPPGSGVFRFGDPPDDVVRAVDELGRIWAQDRLPIVRAVTANAVERLRTGAARALSDAFLLPRGRKDG